MHIGPQPDYYSLLEAGIPVSPSNLPGSVVGEAVRGPYHLSDSGLTLFPSLSLDGSDSEGTRPPEV